MKFSTKITKYHVRLQLNDDDKTMSVKEIAPAGDMCIVRTFQNGKSSENVAKKKAPKQRLPLNGSHTNYLVLFLLLVLALWLAKNIHFK